MDHFSSLEEKVHERETTTATLMFQYNTGSKTVAYLKKNRVDGRELERVFFCHTFWKGKMYGHVVYARI